MIQVVAGILLNQDNEVLIAKRPEGKSYAGYWEFPGGKIEQGEIAETALVRGFQEELGIDTSAERWQPFYQGERKNEVALSFFIARSAKNYMPRSLENQEWQWLAVSHLHQYCFPEPNTKVLGLLQEKFNED